MPITVVTGASRGLGVPLALDLAADGGTIVLAARDAAGLEATAAKIRGATPIIVPCDLTVPADRDRLVARVLALGPPDVVVHNAGVEVPVAVIDQRPDDIDRQIAVNLTGPIQLTRALLPAMIAAGRGVHVYVSSMSGKSPTPYNAVYTATKYGLVGFAGALRIELGGTGLHAGVVCPAFVGDTGMWADTGVKAPAMMREVSPAAVVAATRRVLRGSAEELVTAMPVRPLLGLNQLFPSLDGPVLRALGVLDALRERAKVIAAGRATG